MKRKQVSMSVLAVGLAWLLVGGFGIAQEPEQEPEGAPLGQVGEAFTYQGLLTDGGSPADGLYDFEFELHDHLTANSPVGSSIFYNNVLVTRGLFSVQLDFGSDVFTGDARWLEVRVRPGDSAGPLEVLSPRQELTPAPYALALPGVWTEQHATSPNVIGGYSGNTVSPGKYGATIGGGGTSVHTNYATGNCATVGGGCGNAASNYDTVAGGRQNGATGGFSTIGGGLTNQASAYGSTVPGGYGAIASHHGEMSHASGWFSQYGDAQTSVYVLRNTLSGSGVAELFLDGSSERLTLASGRTMTFDILVVGRSNGGASGGYQIRGVIKNSGGTTAFVGSPTVEELGENDSNMTAYVEADDTNDALAIRAGNTSILFLGTMRWVATVRTVEVTF